jgi:hypothetical protein
MRQFIIAVVVVGCAGGQQGVDARAERPPRAERSAVTRQASTFEATGEHEGNVPFTSAPRFSEADQSDVAFVVNARRAIAEYRSFIEKAGDATEYAEAVARSRERITDLEQMIVFVEQGRDARDPE